MDWEKINYEYLTRNYASIYMIIEHIQIEFVNNIISEIVTFIFQATSNELALYQFPKHTEEEFCSKEIKLVKIDNPSSIAIQCVSLAKDIPDDKNAYNWFSKFRPLSDLTNKYWFNYDFLEKTDIAKIVDLNLMRTPTRERDSKSIANYLTRKILKKGILVDELIFSNTPINSLAQTTSKDQEIAELKRQIEELTADKNIIPTDFSSDEMAVIQEVASEKGISVAELVELATKKQIEEIKPFIDNLSLDTLTLENRKKFEEYVKSNIDNPLEFYSLMANAKILPIEKAGTPAQSEPLKGIARVNYDSGKAQQLARIVAKFLWDMDTNKRIRTGTMANQIYALVHEFDSNATPQTADTVKEWIKSIAPEYAKKGGNEPKEQPPIILTLKN